MKHPIATLLLALAVAMAFVSLPAALFIGLAAGAVEISYLTSKEYRDQRRKEKRDHAHRIR